LIVIQIFRKIGEKSQSSSVFSSLTVLRFLEIIIGTCVCSGVNKEMARQVKLPTVHQIASGAEHSAQNISIIDIMDQNRGSNGTYHQLAEYEAENPPSAGFPSFEGLGYSTEQAPWSIEVVPTLPLQETDEGLGSSRR